MLGVTTPAVVQHAAAVYHDLSPSAQENAAIELAELASEAPRKFTEAKEYLSDSCYLTSGQTAGR